MTCGAFLAWAEGFFAGRGAFPATRGALGDGNALLVVARLSRAVHPEGGSGRTPIGALPYPVRPAPPSPPRTLALIPSSSRAQCLMPSASFPYTPA